MSFGKNIAYYRKKQGITQEELAERLFVSRQTISRWENDSILPDVETVIKLCELFGCSMDTLVRGDAETEEHNRKEERNEEKEEDEKRIKIDLDIDLDEDDDEDDDDWDDNRKRTKRARIAARVNEVISSVTMTSAAFFYVLYGLMRGVWHPTWIAFIIGAGICAISSIITNAIE